MLSGVATLQWPHVVCATVWHGTLASLQLYADVRASRPAPSISPQGKLLDCDFRHSILLQHTCSSDRTEDIPRLHHQLAIHALLGELDALVDDVLVAAPVPEVPPAQVADVLRQPIRRHGVRHDGGAGVLPAVQSPWWRPCRQVACQAAALTHAMAQYATSPSIDTTRACTAVNRPVQ